MQTLEERLRDLRGKLSQNQFGETVGIPQRKLSRLETGQAPLDLDSTQKICNAMNVNADWLLFGRGPKHPGEEHCHEPSISEVKISEVKEEGLMGEGKEFSLKLFEELRESHERERKLMQTITELSVTVSEKNAEIEKLKVENNSLVGLLEEKMFTQNQSKEMNDMTSDEKKTA
jgi:transcriptional regulator with XRE-family HTH domain